MDGVGGETRARLHELSRRRPNVSVVPGSAADAAAAGRGAWLLVLPAELTRQHARLQPAAIERLTAFGEEHTCDAVIGRVDVDGGSRAADPFTADAPRVTGVPAAALSPGLVLLRRDLAIAQGVPTTPDAFAAVVGELGAVGVAGAYESVTIPTPQAEVAGLEVT